MTIIDIAETPSTDAETLFDPIELTFDNAETAPPVTVWGKPGCVQCTATEKDLDRKGIAFEKKSLVDDIDQLEKLKTLGHMQAPVVVFGQEIWSGFRPDKHIEVQAALGLA